MDFFYKRSFSWFINLSLFNNLNENNSWCRRSWKRQFNWTVYAAAVILDKSINKKLLKDSKTIKKIKEICYLTI